MRRVIHIAQGTAARDARCPIGWVHVNALQVREIDHQPVITGAQSRAAVAAPAHGERESVLAGEVDGAHHVGHVHAAGNQRGPLVDHAVVDLARRLVARVAGLNELAAQLRLQLIDHRLIQCDCRLLQGHVVHFLLRSLLPASQSNPLTARCSQEIAFDVRSRTSCRMSAAWEQPP